MVAGVGDARLPGRLDFAPEALQLNWSRLNPANGIKRFGMMQSGVDTLKTLISRRRDRVSSAWRRRRRRDRRQRRGCRGCRRSAPARVGWEHTETLLWRVGVGARASWRSATTALQRYRLMQSLKMTKQEVKDEAKENEGNPEVKGRIRRIQREMARRRMLERRQARHRRHHQPDPLRRGARVPPRRDDGADRARQGRRPHRRCASASRRASTACRSSRTSRSRRRSSRPPRSARRFRRRSSRAVAEVLAYLIRIKQLML